MGSVGLAIAGSLLEPLGKLIEEELADGQKSEAEATRAALARLASEEHLDPVLPKIRSLIADARRPASERDVVAAPPLPSHQPDTDAETTKPE